MSILGKKRAVQCLFSDDDDAADAETRRGPKTQRRFAVRFALHCERRFAPDEAASACCALDAKEETRSVPTTPRVEARRDAAVALRAKLEAEETPLPELRADALDQMRRIVDHKLEVLQRLMERRAEWTPPEDPDDGFFARVPRFTRLPGVWSARDMVPVTLHSLVVLRRLQAEFSCAWAEGAPPEAAPAVTSSS